MNDAQVPTKRQGPVGWLLGPQLLASLRLMALYFVSSGKFDPRDWMTGTVEDLGSDDEPLEYWFDYLADTGDGYKPTYSIACLCFSDLWVSGQPSRGAP